jgi:hypothetical protein
MELHNNSTSSINNYFNSSNNNYTNIPTNNATHNFANTYHYDTCAHICSDV